jgi:hypothetical protein
LTSLSSFWLTTPGRYLPIPAVLEMLP